MHNGQKLQPDWTSEVSTWTNFLRRELNNINLCQNNNDASKITLCLHGPNATPIQFFRDLFTLGLNSTDWISTRNILERELIRLLFRTLRLVYAKNFLGWSDVLNKETRELIWSVGKTGCVLLQIRKRKWAKSEFPEANARVLRTLGKREIQKVRALYDKKFYQELVGWTNTFLNVYKYAP